MIAELSRFWWVIALRGAIGVLFGIVAFAWPVHTLTFLIALFGAYLLLDGVLALISAAGAAKRHENWTPMVLEGLAGVIIGLVTFFWPGLTLVAVVYVMSAWAIVTGALAIYAAIKLRKAISGEWLLLLSGGVSVLLGVMLAVSPGAGAIAILWLMGSYAIVFGCLLIALALRLRGHGQNFQTHAHV